MATITGLFGVTDWDKAGQMTLEEFRIRHKGYMMRRLDDEYDTHLLAFRIRDAKAVDKSGKKYVFKAFKDFYNADKRREEVLGSRKKNMVSEKLLTIAKRMKNFKGGNY